MYNGVPNNVNFYEVYGFGTTLLNPKSDNLAIPCFNLFHIQLGFSYWVAGLWASLFTVMISIVLATPYSRYVDDIAIKVSNRLTKIF